MKRIIFSIKDGHTTTQRVTPFIRHFTINHSTSVIGVALVSLSPLSYADAPVQTENSVLPTIVVSANKTATALQDTPAAVSGISRTTLVNKHPTFIGQVLDEIPGVKLADLSNEQHMTSIRQPITTSAVYQFLEDGISIRPVGVFNHNALYETNLGGIGAIEVLRGPASSLYGNNAVGGAINLYTAAPTQTLTGYGQLQGSSEGFRRLDAGVSNTFDTAIGAQGLRVSAYASERNGGWQSHAEGEKQSVTLRHDIKLSDATRIKNIVTYNHLYTDMTGSLTQTQWDKGDIGYSAQDFTFRKVDALRASSQINHQWSKQQQTQATVFIRDNRTFQNPSYLIFNNPTNTSLASGRTTDNQFTSYGVDLQQHGSSDQLTWVGGVLLDYTPTQNKEVNLSIQRDPSTGRYISYTTGSVRRDYTVDIYNTALYAQADYRIMPQVLISAGARHDRITYDYTNQLSPSATTGAASGSKRYQKTSPKLGVVFNLNPHIDLYSNRSQGYTPPEVSSQYGGALAVPNLQAATYNNTDVGLRFNALNKQLQGEIGIYRLTGKNELVSYKLPNNTTEPRNAGETLHQGVEFASHYQFADAYHQKLRISGSVAKHTYERYDISATQSYTGNEMPCAPRHVINVEYSVQPLHGLNLSVEGSKVGRYWQNDANTLRYDGHTLLNVRANYDINRWQLFAQVLNLTDKQYAEQATVSNNAPSYTPGAPRTFIAGVRYRFDASAR